LNVAVDDLCATSLLKSLPAISGRRVLVLANLKPRNMVGFKSHGMVLCASNDDHTAVKFVDVPPSAKVSI